MGIIGLSSKQWGEIDGKLGGFSLCPAGTGLLFEVTAHREGTYTDKKTGDEIEYVTFGCSHIDEDGLKHDHWEFFGLTDQNIPFLKGFLEKLERHDIFELGEDGEWSALYGTAFTGDIRHRVKDKETKELQSNLVQNTITAVSHEEGKVVEGWKDQVGLNSGEEEEEEAPKPHKKKAVKKATKKVAKKEEPEEEEEEEFEEEDSGEEEEEDDTPPKRSKRRSRRAERED